MSNRISVIIPAYNNLELFKQAFESVRKQEEVECEIIVVDDSTTSSIEDYVRSQHLQGCKYYHNHPSLGAVRNWNKGLRLATLSYLILLHHDEYFPDPHYLSTVCQWFDRGYDVVVSQVKVFINGQLYNRHMIPFLKKIMIGHPALLFAMNVIGPCACIAVKREYASTFDENLSWLVDVEWYYRMLKGRKVKFKYANPSDWVYSVHGHGGQITETIDIHKTFLADASHITSLNKYRNNPAIRLSLAIGRMIDTMKFVLRTCHKNRRK
jgi:glycosyltransferase involved in cell wall biosynthesis